MKIGKQELKSLIKECLVEILAEGLGEQITEAVHVRPRQQGQQRAAQQPVKRSSPPQRQSPALLNAIQEAAGQDDVMKDIFADTARNTLPTMLSEGRGAPQQPSGNSIEDQIVARHDPATIFGEEQVDRWASLAFSANKPK